jgi:8-oxo-dGTP pyrophosphatase MutT (NUDIX family)
VPISAYLKSLRERIGTDLVLMPSVGAIIRDEAGRILLARNRDTGGWMLPGGAIDPGEGPREAVIREAREETGLQVEPVQIAGVVGPWSIRYPNGDQVEYTGTMFLCRVVGGHLEAVDGEADGFGWFRPEEMPWLGFPPALWRWQPGDPVIF